jgi:hypothetical protein
VTSVVICESCSVFMEQISKSCSRVLSPFYFVLGLSLFSEFFICEFPPSGLDFRWFFDFPLVLWSALLEPQDLVHLVK